MKNEYAPNHTGGKMDMYESNEDTKRLNSQTMPNTRTHGYITNQFAGGGVHKTEAKVKGKIENKKQEVEYGNDYGR